MKKITIITTILVVCLSMGSALGCSTFAWKDKDGNPWFGRNFDFPSGLGQIHINLKGIEKTSIPTGDEKPFTWVSEYGSISFNQNGREFPYGGMNEAGLVIEQMWHQDAKYPETDERYGLTELQWIQYQLDRSANVAEVIESDGLLRISKASIATLHFLVADAQGNVAVIEYIDGKMKTYSQSELPHPVLTNCSYEVSLQYVKTKKANPTEQFNPWTENSSGRFMTAASMLEQANPAELSPVDFSFDVLSSVAQNPGTVWSIVYDIKNRSIHYKTIQSPDVKTIKMSDFEYTCNSPWLMTDISTTPNFEPFTFAANFKIIDGVCNEVEFLRQMPAEFRILTARYPESMECKP